MAVTADKVARDYKNHIDNAFKGGSLPHTLCMLALTMSVSAFKSFNEYMSSQCRTYEAQGIAPKKCWALTTRLGHCILTKLHNAHSAVHNKHEFDNLKQIACLQLFSAAKSLDALQTFVDVSFERHPCIANTIMQFSLEADADGTGLNKMKEELIAALPTKKEIKDLNKRCDTFSNKLKELVTTDALDKKLAKYKKEG